MFRVTQEIEFCYGHRLLNYDGKCKHLHGHNGKAVIVLEGSELDEKGMLLDFSDLKRKIGAWIEDNLDHRMILCKDDPAASVMQKMGEPVYLIHENPTAENIARLIYSHTRSLGLAVREVTLWESLKSHATYSEATSGETKRKSS